MPFSPPFFCKRLRYEPVPALVFLRDSERSYARGHMKDELGNYEVTPFLSNNVQEAMRQCAKTGAEQTPTLPQVTPLLPVSKPPQSAKMAIKVNGKILFIDPTELVSVHAEGNYVLLQKQSGSYLLRATISEMVSKLERYGFIRIHRSLLINTFFVEEMETYPTGTYGLRVRGGKVYMVSRTYKKNLNSLADSWVGSDAFFSE